MCMLIILFTSLLMYVHVCQEFLNFNLCAVVFSILYERSTISLLFYLCLMEVFFSTKLRYSLFSTFCNPQIVVRHSLLFTSNSYAWICSMRVKMKEFLHSCSLIYPLCHVNKKLLHCRLNTLIELWLLIVIFFQPCWFYIWRRLSNYWY